MYFAVMIVVALLVVVVVLLLEHRGDPKALEREYNSRPTLTHKNNSH